MPPVMPFHLGSLGFLTPFNFDTYQSQVTQVIEGECPGLCVMDFFFLLLKGTLTGIELVSPQFKHFASLFVLNPGSYCSFTGPFPSAWPCLMLRSPFLMSIYHVSRDNRGENGL